MNEHDSIKGMDLCRRYYEEFGKKAMENVLHRFPGLQAAYGLVGEGSQCFGYDDEISRDHDFAPGFCIWLSEEDYKAAGGDLAAAYGALPDTFLGFSRYNVIARDRLGVMTVRSFYGRFTGCAGTKALPGLPETNWDWFLISEHALASATNGLVFRDDSGVFSAVRKKLLDFYPEDVRRKKIAARAAVMSQAGQYNLLRAVKRGDTVAAMISASRFTEAAMSMVYLLNRRYAPFYKWTYRGLADLEILTESAAGLKELPRLLGQMEGTGLADVYSRAFAITEEVCAAAAAELRRQKISAVNSDFLQDHLGDIMGGIKDPKLSALSPMVDCSN